MFDRRQYMRNYMRKRYAAEKERKLGQQQTSNRQQSRWLAFPERTKWIRRMREEGHTIIEIAAWFRVSPSTIHDLLNDDK